MSSWYERAVASAYGLPITSTWLLRSPDGLISTGFIAASGSIPHAAACIACARPISAPVGVTVEFSDMFCALNGATDTPWRLSQRQIAATVDALAGVGRGAGDQDRALHRRTIASTAVASEMTRASRIARATSPGPGARPVPSCGRCSTCPA